ncbi:MAG: hypothetical protein Q7T44_08170 [Parvibaculum sp.]|nr:hypothetical protein [Parvibaculum sp.]
MDSANRKIARKALLLSMEKVIARSCYNGHIQNYGAWGALEDEGRFFRFPLTLFNSDCPNEKSKNPDVGISLDSLKSSFYKFGANELHVIEALDFILANLEMEYGLDIYTSSPSSFLPEGYKLLNSETVFEATACIGEVSGGWVFDNPLARDIYESPEGVRHVYVRDSLYPVCGPELMKEIVESCASNGNLWYRFQTPRSNDQRYFSFVERGSRDEIQKLHSLKGEKN